MLIVRTAELEDAQAIARVHVETWQSTYSGIIPQGYLDGLTVQNRQVGWMRLLERTGPGDFTLVSEDDDERVVGFLSGGPLRHSDSRFQAEISLLYVSRRGQGHGRRLFLAAANRLAQAGYNGLFVWVLADNPARGFYEAMGGERVAEITRPFAGKPLQEIGYGWTQMPTYG